VWICRPNGVPNPALDDPNFQAIVEQWQKVQLFFKHFNNADGSLKGGYNPYETPDDFRRQFEQHMRSRIDAFLENLPKVAVSIKQEITHTKPIWPGSP
jgi:hypothetical protein